MPDWNKLTPEEQFNEGLFAVTQAVLAAAAEIRLKITAEEAGRAARAAIETGRPAVLTAMSTVSTAATTSEV